MEAFSQRMADDLALLRPLVMAPAFDPGGAVRIIRRVSATLTAYKGLDERLDSCDPTADLARRVEVLLGSLAEIAEGSLSAPVNAAQVQRDASVALFGLLPEVLALSETATGVADSLGMQMAVAMVPDGAEEAVGSLPPLPTPTPRPTVRSTPRPTTRPTTGGGSSGSDWTKTANAYTDSVNATYGRAIPAALRDAGAKLFGMYCDLPTGEQRYECMVGYVREISGGIRSAANAHLTFMKKHPAAQCFADAYAADRKVANAYLAAAHDVNGDNWSTLITKADRLSSAFLEKFRGYFSDCR